MLESFMEDLLWRYPDDFFPGRGFKPVKRQFTLSGAGRLDISFRDNLGRLWVIEVKAVAVRTEVADQVYRYAQSLREAHPHDRPFPAVVAPVINATVREHFDRWGIEYYEISEAMFRRVATERGVEMESTEPTTTTAAMAEGIQRGNRALSSPYVYKPLAAHKGNVTTVTLSGVPYKVVHVTLDGKTTLCNHGLHNVDKLTSLKRNWVVVESAATCSKCLAVMAKGL